MKCIVNVLLLLLLPLTNLLAQAPLNLESAISALYVTPGEQLIIVDRAGEVAMADSLNGKWHYSKKEDETLDHAIFFNRDTGFVAGFIHNDGNENIIYHTKNGGKSWENVDFGSSGWADGAWNLDDGKAWMTISGKGIVYSKDYGLTWTLFPVEDIQQRYQSVFFNQKQEGIIGSVYNSIAYTDDNCLHWKKIPSPLDQQAYIKTNKTSRPEIDKVCIYQNLLLVSQEGMLFFSQKNNIQWKPLTAYRDFSTDATNTALFLISNKNELVRVDEQLARLQMVKLDGYRDDLYTRNGKAFFVYDENIHSLDTDGRLHTYPMQTAEKLVTTPHFIYSPDVEINYGIDGNMIYTHNDSGWKYAFTLPYTVQDIQSVAVNKNILTYQTNDSLLHYYDITTHKETVTTMKKMLNEFQQSPVTSVIFSQGSNGCFHSNTDALTYEPEDNTFILSDFSSLGSTHTSTLKPEIDEISKCCVEQFVKEICLHADRQPVIQDMNFSKQDYKQCKASIKAYQEDKRSTFYFHKNNADFDRLLSTVDAIKSIDSISLNAALPNVNSGIYSTTRDMIAVTFTNEAGAKLNMECSLSGPKGGYICWKISLNNNTITSTSPVITAFFEKFCPSAVADQDKVAVLQALVRSTYK